MLTALIVLAAILTVVALTLFFSSWRARRRSSALRDLIDGADEMERLLKVLKEHIHQLKTLLDQIPGNVKTEAQKSLDSDQKVHSALRDVLEHRMWIQKHGASASDSELNRAREAMQKSRSLLDQQISKLKLAGHDLEAACQVAYAKREAIAEAQPSQNEILPIELIDREPPSATRH